MAEQTIANAKLVQFLTEALTTEKQLEAALEAHIGMTERAPYKKRLRQHLTETKRHARELERRIKQLGGSSTLGEATAAATALAGKALAAAQGPLHAVRGTSVPEKELRNARTEFSSEAEEIATYRAIETLAESVGDKETAQLARAIRREEERMANYLEKLIPTLTKAVATKEIPASERNGGRRRSSRRTGSTRSRASSNSRASSRSGSRSAGSRRTSGSSTRRKSRSTARSR
jgi:ferritin-like metal-binding protein YciE